MHDPYKLVTAGIFHTSRRYTLETNRYLVQYYPTKISLSKIHYHLLLDQSREVKLTYTLKPVVSFSRTLVNLVLKLGLIMYRIWLSGTFSLRTFPYSRQPGRLASLAGFASESANFQNIFIRPILPHFFHLSTFSPFHTPTPFHNITLSFIHLHTLLLRIPSEYILSLAYIPSLIFIFPSYITLRTYINLKLVSYILTISLGCPTPRIPSSRF